MFLIFWGIPLRSAAKNGFRYCSKLKSQWDILAANSITNALIHNVETGLHGSCQQGGAELTYSSLPLPTPASAAPHSPRRPRSFPHLFILKLSRKARSVSPELLLVVTAAQRKDVLGRVFLIWVQYSRTVLGLSPRMHKKMYVRAPSMWKEFKNKAVMGLPWQSSG